MNSIDTLDMKENGEIMLSMDLDNSSGTINFFFKENFKMDLSMVQESINIKMEIFLMEISLEIKEEVMEVTILPKEEFFSQNLILYQLRYQN